MSEYRDIHLLPVHPVGPVSSVTICTFLSSRLSESLHRTSFKSNHKDLITLVFLAFFSSGFQFGSFVVVLQFSFK